ncbi:MAG: LamG domain-containing protein [Phycisphaerae bacterium]|nr:LamG domain-containing protein [Phycisphaerae bacterium]
MSRLFLAVKAALIPAVLSAGTIARAQRPAALHLPQKGLVGHWSGEGDARDSVGRNHGIIKGDTALAPGRVGRAFKFDGKDDYVQLGSGNAKTAKALQITGSQTIAMWIRPDRLTGRQSILHTAYGGEVSIVLEPTGELSYMYGSSGRNDSPFILCTSFGKVEDTGVSAGEIAVYKTQKTAIAAKKWTHIAIVRDLTAKRLRLYINAKLVVETGTTIPAASVSNLPVLLGRGFVNSFSGLIDEVAIWNRALNAGEIGKTHALSRITADPLAGGLVGLWLGNGNSRDALGKHHGRTRGQVSYTLDRHRKARRAFQFTGSGAIIIPDHDDLDTDEAFTLSLWVKQKTPRTDIAHLAVKWGRKHADYSLELDRQGRPYLLVHGDDAEDRLTAKSPLPPNAWSHVAATFNRGEMKLYINGKLSASGVASTVKRTCSKEYEADDVAIGAEGNIGQFVGALDELGIWNRALSAEEIARVAKAHSLSDLLSYLTPHLTRKLAGDLVILKDGSVMTGSIVNKAFLLSGAFGKVTIPAGRVVGFAANRTKTRQVRLVLTDGQTISGAILDQHVQVKLSSNPPLKIPPADIAECGYRISADKPAILTISEPTVSLLNGDRFIWTGGLDKLVLKTPYATMALPVKSITNLVLSLRDREKPFHRVQLTNGSTISGVLTTGKITLVLQLGPKITIKASDLLQISRLGRTVSAVGTARVNMRNGDRLLAGFVGETLKIKTEFGKAGIPIKNVRIVTFDPKKPEQVAVAMSDGTTLRGRLTEQILTFKITGGGPTVKLNIAQVASVAWRP